MYVSVAGISSATIPGIGKGDSALHIEYALSVYHGHIPKYHDPIRYPAFHQIAPDHYKVQIQRAAQNPPLFYFLHAPIVGPLLDSGHWKKAFAIGYAFNIFLGVLAVLAMAWAGWLFGGKRKELFAVAVPAVGSLSYQFTNLNQNYALDALLVLLAVMTTIVWYKLIQKGFQRRYLLSLFLLSIFGMATKATYIAFLGISLLTIMVAAFIHGRGSRFKKLLNGSVISAVLVVAVIICTGWFYYYWNYKTSGKWYTGELPGDFPERNYKSLSTVLTHSDLWANFYKRLTASELLSKLITLTAFIGVVFAAFTTKFTHFRRDKKHLFGIILLTLVLLGTTLTQITHAVGIGSFNFRYFLPAILVFSLFIVYGLLEIKRGAVLLGVVVVAMATTSVITVAKLDYIASKIPAVSMTDNIYSKLNIAMTSNGFSQMLLIFLLGLLVVGVLAVVTSLFLLSKPAKQT